MPKAGDHSITVAAPPHITLLPFVRPAERADGRGKRDFWVVATTGDTMLDIEMGTALAWQALAYIRESGLAPLLGWIVGDMIAHGRFGGVEVGFCSVLAKELLK